MGEYFYSKMVDFDNGTPEDSYGNNRLFQGSRLQECILLGVRLGMDIEILEKWKAKL